MFDDFYKIRNILTIGKARTYDDNLMNDHGFLHNYETKENLGDSYNNEDIMYWLFDN